MRSLCTWERLAVGRAMFGGIVGRTPSRLEYTQLTQRLLLVIGSSGAAQQASNRTERKHVGKPIVEKQSVAVFTLLCRTPNWVMSVVSLQDDPSGLDDLGSSLKVNC